MQAFLKSPNLSEIKVKLENGDEAVVPRANIERLAS